MLRVPCIAGRSMAVLGVLISVSATSAMSSRRDRHDDNSKIQNVAGAALIESSLPYDKTFDLVINSLKKQGYTIDVADKDAGQVATTFSTTKNFKAVRSRVQVIFIKDSDTKTTLRVASAEQKRKRGLTASADEWHDPTVDSAATSQIAEAVQASLESASH